MTQGYLFILNCSGDADRAKQLVNHLKWPMNKKKGTKQTHQVTWTSGWASWRCGEDSTNSASNLPKPGSICLKATHSQMLRKMENFQQPKRLTGNCSISRNWAFPPSFTCPEQSCWHLPGGRWGCLQLAVQLPILPRGELTPSFEEPACAMGNMETGNRKTCFHLARTSLPEGPGRRETLLLPD